MLKAKSVLESVTTQFLIKQRGQTEERAFLVRPFFLFLRFLRNVRRELPVYVCVLIVCLVCVCA